LPGVRLTAEQVYRVLLERSGLLREPVDGRADFVHRTFQEYLAAKEAVEQDDVGVLVSQAHLDQWRETIVLAAGHANPGVRARLLAGLLDAGDRQPPGQGREALHLLALACLGVSPECDAAVRARALAATADLVPPKSREAAETLARVGPLALDLLTASTPIDEAETANTIRALGLIGDQTALPFLVRFGADARVQVIQTLLEAWSGFDPDEYARRVLRDSPMHNGAAVVTDSRLLGAARHLRHLRALEYISSRWADVDLGFLPHLPHLRTLSIVFSSDLMPVARSNLATLRIEGGTLRVAGMGALDVGPLADARELRGLWIPELVVRNIGALADAPRLETLFISAAGLRGPIRATLSRLRRLSLFGTAAAEDLRRLPQLTPGVTHLHLRGLAPNDLQALADLDHLKALGLRDPGVVLLSDLAGSRSLRSLTLEFFDPDDLNRALRDIPTLTSLTSLNVRLHTNTPSVVNLKPLRGLGLRTVGLDFSPGIQFFGGEGVNVVEGVVRATPGAGW
jgi:hypothetical protein